MCTRDQWVDTVCAHRFELRRSYTPPPIIARRAAAALLPSPLRENHPNSGRPPLHRKACDIVWTRCNCIDIRRRVTGCINYYCNLPCARIYVSAVWRFDNIAVTLAVTLALTPSSNPCRAPSRGRSLFRWRPTAFRRFISRERCVVFVCCELLATISNTNWRIDRSANDFVNYHEWFSI